MTKYAMSSYQRASGTRDAFARLSADLVAEGFPEITVNSGDREPEAQEAIFRSKFVPSSGPRDVGPFNDRRYWPGHGYWKRMVGGGTVGVPGTSNHEKRRAADLAYPYNSNTPAHRRAQVLAKRHNITCEGMGFAEWWHWTYWGPLGTIDQPGQAAGGTSTPEEGFLMGLSDYDQQLTKNAAVDINNRTADMAIALSQLPNQIAQAVLFPGATFNGFLALANNQAAILEAIKALDPSKSSDIAAFEAKLRESERRTAESVKATVEQSVNSLRETITKALADGGVSPYADVRKAVDDAFDEVFVRPSQS